MRFAYADPPYLGQARRHYSHDPNAAEVNHPLLVAYLQTFDAWALSLSAPSLRVILPMCPPEARVMPWVKPFASFKPGVRVAYAWEPVIVCGGRPGTREDPTVRDWVAANITMQRGLCGAKPQAFSWWLFEVWGATLEDELSDVFPGSGAVGEAWTAYRGRLEALTGRSQLELVSG